MSPARIVKSAASAIVVLSCLIVVGNAGAAAWQGPLQISDPNVNVGDTTARISLGTSGDAGAGWWDEGDLVTSRIFLARKRAGAAWSAPITVATGQTSQPILVGTDGAGDVTAAYNSVGPITQIVSWAAGAATATTVPVTDQNVAVQDLAVNASGDAVISGIASGTLDIRVAYRHGFTGAWSAWHSFTGPALQGSTSKVAINAAGMAVVTFRATTEYWAATRTATTDWPAAAERVTLDAVDNTSVPSVAIDGAGGVYTAYVANPAAGSFILRTAYRNAAAAVWELSGPLTTSTTSLSAQIVMNPAGTALLVWQQTSATAIQARLGSTGNRIWGLPETVNDAGADVPVAAISNDGTAVVAWEREVAAGSNIGQARVRAPGAAGTWGDIHNLTALHANGNLPSISTDGRGDFATISAPYDGTTAKHAVVNAYDASPPTVSAPSVTGTLLAGDPLVLGVNATDEWSAVGTPAWTFGDGGTGTGLTPVHTYATAGTFTAHVTVTDGSGNSSSQDVSVFIGSPQSTLTSAKFTGKWKVSTYTGGTLTVTGTVPRAGDYTIDILKGASRKLRLQAKLTAAGAFTRAIKLTGPKFFPGTYSIVLTPGDAQVKGASRTAAITAPASGVVDVAFLSGARSGTAARTLTGAKTIWASFHFAAKPKGTLKLTWYKVGKKRKRIGATSKSSATKIVSYLRIGGVFTGTYQAELSRKGVVIARVSVKTKKK
jgi:hypothetical protein